MTLCVNEYLFVSLNQPDKISNDRLQLFPECWVGVLRNECMGWPTEKGIANIFAGMLISTERIVRSQQAFSFDKHNLFCLLYLWVYGFGWNLLEVLPNTMYLPTLAKINSCWVSRFKSSTNTINSPVSIVICNHDCCLHGHTQTVGKKKRMR